MTKRTEANLAVAIQALRKHADGGPWYIVYDTGINNYTVVYSPSLVFGVGFSSKGRAEQARDTMGAVTLDLIFNIARGKEKTK